MYSDIKKNLAFRPLVSLSEWHKPRKKSGTSIISLLIAITIIFPCLTWAFEAGTYPRLSGQVMFNHLTIEISPQLGTVTKSFQGNERVVVLMQDLHCNYEVQDNIAKLIGRLARRQGLKLVAVEAAAGPVDVSRLASFPIESVKKETARYLMKQGRITGPELYAATGKHAIRLAGIENPELYEANLAGVKKFLNCQSQGYILDLRETLNELKRGVDNGLLEKFDKLLRTGLYTTPAQAEMDAWQRRLDIMEKLLNISASPEELAEYRAAPERFKVQRFLDYIARYAEQGELRPDAEVYKLDRYLKAAKEFYQVADERSLAFVENTVQQMDQHNAKLAVLVAGGYHTDEVLGELKQRGISYICVKPRLRRPDVVNPYLALLRNQRMPLEKLLARNQNILGLATLWPSHKLSSKQSEFKRLLVHLLKIGALVDSFKTGARSVPELRRRYGKKIGEWAKTQNQNISILWESVELKGRAVFAPFNTGITVMILDRIRSRIKTGAKLNIYPAPVLVILSSEAGRLKRQVYAVARGFSWKRIADFLPSRWFPLTARKAGSPGRTLSFLAVLLISLAGFSAEAVGRVHTAPQTAVSQEDIRQEVKKIIWFLNLIKKSDLAFNQDSLAVDLKQLKKWRESLRESLRRKVLDEKKLLKIKQDARQIRKDMEEEIEAEATENLREWEWEDYVYHEEITEMLCNEIFTPLEMAVLASIKKQPGRIYRYSIVGKRGRQRAIDINGTQDKEKVLDFYKETIAWMKEEGLEPPEMARIIAYWPDVLSYGNARLQSRKALLKELGVESKAAIRIFKKMPNSYGLNWDNLIAEIAWLRGVEEEWETSINIPKVLETYPAWSGFSAEDKIEPALDLYAQMQNKNNKGNTIIKDLNLLLSRNITILGWIVEEMTEPDQGKKVPVKKVIAVYDALIDEVKGEKGVTPARMLHLACKAESDKEKEKATNIKASGRKCKIVVHKGGFQPKEEEKDSLIETEEYLRAGIKIIINFKQELTRWLSWHGFEDLCSELEITPQDEWEDIVWKLGGAAFNSDRAALEAIIKLICEPPGPDDLKAEALGVLGYATTQHRPHVIQRGESVIPDLEKNLRSPLTSEELKVMSIKMLKQLALEGSSPALEAMTRQMAYLARFINTPQIDDALSIASMQAVGYAASKNIPSAIAVIASSTPALVNFFTSSQTHLDLQICSLEALGQAAAQGNQTAVSAIEGMMPFLLEELKNDDIQTSYKLSPAVIIAISYAAAGGGELAARSMEKSIRSSDTEYLSKKLYYLSFAISKAGRPVLQAAERLVPFLEHLITDTQTAHVVRVAAMKALGALGAEGNQIALAALESVLPDLEHAMTASPNSDAFKGAMAILKWLPLKIKGPQVKLGSAPYPVISLDEVLSRVESPCNPRFAGRSLVYDLPEGKILEIKILRDQGDIATLSREPFYWRYLEKLKQKGYFKNIRFDLGRVLKFSGSDMIKLKNVPLKPPGNIQLHPDLYAVCSIQQGEYYSYANSAPSEGRPSKAEAKEEFFRAAYLFGYLASLGIPQGEIIPFMHSVRYANKRRDQGQLQWWWGGRVDNWLQACDYPNFGKTGPRDTEHIISWGVDKAPFGYEDDLGLFHLLGRNEFDLLLAVGSYFRNEDRSRMGLDNNGNPVDARDLFDEELLKEMIVGIFLFYHEGFIRAKYSCNSACDSKHLIQRMEKHIGKLPFDLETLTQRMIEEMGVDRHLRLRLTTEEQDEMCIEDFKSYLLDNGYSEREIARFKKGEKEIPLINGPHLGKHDGGTSLPEMIEAINAMVTVCIAGRYKADYMGDTKPPTVSGGELKKSGMDFHAQAGIIAVLGAGATGLPGGGLLGGISIWGMNLPIMGMFPLMGAALLVLMGILYTYTALNAGSGKADHDRLKIIPRRRLRSLGAAA